MITDNFSNSRSICIYYKPSQELQVKPYFSKRTTIIIIFSTFSLLIFCAKSHFERVFHHASNDQACIFPQVPLYCVFLSAHPLTLHLFYHSPVVYENLKTTYSHIKLWLMQRKLNALTRHKPNLTLSEACTWRGKYMGDAGKNAYSYGHVRMW